jgi:hypothetical protein
LTISFPSPLLGLMGWKEGTAKLPHRPYRKLDLDKKGEAK